jgi:hypothetical protein
MRVLVTTTKRSGDLSFGDVKPSLLGWQGRVSPGSRGRRRGGFVGQKLGAVSGSRLDRRPCLRHHIYFLRLTLSIFGRWSLATVLDEVDRQHLLTQLFELVSVKTLNICSRFQALGRWIRVGFFTSLGSSAELVTLLALGTFISFAPFTTFATN